MASMKPSKWFVATQRLRQTPGNPASIVVDVVESNVDALTAADALAVHCKKQQVDIDHVVGAVIRVKVAGDDEEAA